MQLFRDLIASIERNSNRNAFHINGSFYNYAELCQHVSDIKKEIRKHTSQGELILGLVTNDDLSTYASIIALWSEGMAYVPLSPESPMERNKDIIAQVGIKTILDSSNHSQYTDISIIQSSSLAKMEIELSIEEAKEDKLAYIFFTSGTTGVPKGVPISRKNLTAFMVAFKNLQLEIDENDRFLQMFDLTFDLSVMSFLVPLLNGSCTYTIPKNKIKYSYIYELLEGEDITVALMVPSILHFLRPYFDEIKLPKLKYSLFCGEALQLDIAQAWNRCAPMSQVLNVYGPTEHTIFCTTYWLGNDDYKSKNGILSIGKDMTGSQSIIVDENNEIVPTGSSGQLCLSGDQLTQGYWKNDEKNATSFFQLRKDKISTRYYKTGDICVQDEEGDLLYLGRLDSQIQVQGFRVELSEVEFHVKNLLENVNSIVLAFTNTLGNTELGLVIESEPFEINDFLQAIRKNLPSYMIPSKTLFLNNLPLNTNGKIDRNKLISDLINS